MLPWRNLHISFLISLAISFLHISCESIFLPNTITPQILSPSQSFVYSSYSSTQIFHLLNWQVNNRIIEGINSDRQRTFTAGHNQFSYLSINEINQQYLTVDVDQLSKIRVQAPSAPATTPKSNEQTPFQPFFVGSPPNLTYNYDWRNKFSTPVKDQGACGACWAFAAIADLESTYMLQYQYRVDFSQQQLIDCSNSFGNEGCGGGMMNSAFQYVIKMGVTLESYYPFRQTAGECKYSSATMPHFSIGKSSIIVGDCNALANILKQRPVSVVVSANLAFIFYQSGILNSCGSTINHALQLVGMVKSLSGSYYIGKNSWGTAWGMQGYVYIDSQEQGGNLCNVCSYPQYPS